MYSSKSKPIEIPQPNKPIVKSDIGEYGLKPMLFDPSKSSPPNEFMNKLRVRVATHDSLSRRIVMLK